MRWKFRVIIRSEDIRRCWKRLRKYVYVVIWCRQRYLPQDTSCWRRNITRMQTKQRRYESIVLLTRVTSNTFFRSRSDTYLGRLREKFPSILANISRIPSAPKATFALYFRLYFSAEKKIIATTRGILWPALRAVVWQEHSVTQGIIRTFIVVSRNSPSRFTSNYAF